MEAKPKYLEFDGKRYELVEIPEKPKCKTGYERNNNGNYYTIGHSGCLMEFKDTGRIDSNIFASANYYTDKQLAKYNARADALMRNLRRFTAEGRQRRISWDNCSKKYTIYFSYYDDNQLKTEIHHNTRKFGAVWFDTEELANTAIEKYRDELMWYFTEYQDTAEFREGDCNDRS